MCVYWCFARGRARISCARCRCSFALQWFHSGPLSYRYRLCTNSPCACAIRTLPLAVRRMQYTVRNWQNNDSVALMVLLLLLLPLLLLLQWRRCLRCVCGGIFVYCCCRFWALLVLLLTLCSGCGNGAICAVDAIMVRKMQYKCCWCARVAVLVAAKSKNKKSN